MILVCTGGLSAGHGHSHEEIEVPVEESIQVGGTLRVLCVHTLHPHRNGQTDNDNHDNFSRPLLEDSSSCSLSVSTTSSRASRWASTRVRPTPTSCWLPSPPTSGSSPARWGSTGPDLLYVQRHLTPLNIDIYLPAQSYHCFPVHECLLWNFSNRYRSRNCSESGICRLLCCWHHTLLYAIIQADGGAVLLVFQGLATGSLLYVVFFEILEKERVKDVNGFAQAMSMTFGYLFMIGLSGLETLADGEGEGEAAFNGTFINSTAS